MNQIEKIREQVGINIQEEEKQRMEFINYLKELRERDITEYQKIMADFVSDDYGVVLGPKSAAGKVYKYDSGVIGIDENGNREEIDCDKTKDSHSVATIKIGCLLNEKFKERYQNSHILVAPYEIGTILSDYGVLVIQLEGDSMLVYLPSNELTDIQSKLLQDEITVRDDLFKIDYTRNGEILDNFKKK